MSHIIWDWNGTLFNDLHLLAEATSSSSALIGGPAVDTATYQRHHVRPFSAFYTNLVGRELTTEEWTQINEHFHVTYADILHRATLAEDGIAALDAVAASGTSQSLLSMWVHDQLVPLATKLGVHNYFVRVDGLSDVGGDSKFESLERHIAQLETLQSQTIDRSTITMIGDTIDDGESAQRAGVNAVLVSTGAQLPADLKTVGWPVEASLLAAVKTALA